MIFSNKLKNLLSLILLILVTLILNSSVLSQQLPVRVQVDSRGLTGSRIEEVMSESQGYTASVPVRVTVYYHDRLVGGLVDVKLLAGKDIKIEYIKGKVNLGGELYSTPSGVSERPQIDPPVENGNLGALYGVWVTVDTQGNYSYQFNSAFLIGLQKVVTVPPNKYLFMFVNDDNYNDNSGNYEVEVSYVGGLSVLGGQTNQSSNNTQANRNSDKNTKDKLKDAFDVIETFYTNTAKVNSVKELEEAVSISEKSLKTAVSSISDFGILTKIYYLFYMHRYYRYLELDKKGKIDSRSSPETLKLLDDIVTTYTLKNLSKEERLRSFAKKISDFRLTINQ